MTKTLEEQLATFGKAALRIKDERDALLTALAPFVKAYEASYDPRVSDLDDEQPYHLRVPLGDCRTAASAYHFAFNHGGPDAA